MAAANSNSARGIASLGKRVVDKIWTRDPPPCLSYLSPASVLTFRRAAHTSVYDKNPEEQVRPSVVPDHVIQPLSEEYWAPHPQTGVFGPPKDHGGAAGVHTADGGGQDSVLEQQAWFRPTSLEDLEKPHHHN